ncbi:hypothetical protein ANN_00819 [Periplaneta americana]|uniref:Uncharacterized protein n=1 Tax=Periplaneta americana TaxID=6978 RepID=A0ABQ8TUS8_PERAM|nr:hypothetical protein ANN_00819 [Periplaneta americana]
MSPGSSTKSYPALARIGLRENPGKISTSRVSGSNGVPTTDDDDDDDAMTKAGVVITSCNHRHSNGYEEFPAHCCGFHSHIEGKQWRYHVPLQTLSLQAVRGGFVKNEKENFFDVLSDKITHTVFDAILNTPHPNWKPEDRAGNHLDSADDENNVETSQSEVISASPDVPEFCPAGFLLHASKSTDMSLSHLSTLKCHRPGLGSNPQPWDRRPALYQLANQVD